VSAVLQKPGLKPFEARNDVILEPKGLDDFLTAECLSYHMGHVSAILLGTTDILPDSFS
jgi:hypothetical protein